MMVDEHDYWAVVRELYYEQRKHRKANHDRQRYASRIRFLQWRHEILSLEYNALLSENEALCKELDILRTALAACERQLLG